jgi:hypothetical protein
MGRRGRRRGRLPQIPEPVTVTRWDSLPEVNRRAVVRLLAMIAGKAAGTPADAAMPASPVGEPWPR